MKVLVLTGSPHDNGCSAYLADHYIEGARQKGHDVVRFDTGRMAVHSCTGCNHCRKSEGKCIFDDGMSSIYPQLLSANRVVLVTPLYYFGMTAQLKSVLDRFYAVNPKLREMDKELDLLAVGADDDIHAFAPLVSHIQTTAAYLSWRMLEPLLAQGFAERADIEKSDFAEKAKTKGMSC